MLQVKSKYTSITPAGIVATSSLLTWNMRKTLFYYLYCRFNKLCMLGTMLKGYINITILRIKLTLDLYFTNSINHSTMMHMK